MLLQSPSVTGRVLTFLSLFFLVSLSFAAPSHHDVLNGRSNPHEQIIHRRLEIITTPGTTTSTTTTDSASSTTTTTTASKSTTTEPTTTSSSTSTTTTTDSSTDSSTTTTTTTTTSSSSSSILSITSTTTTTTTSATPKPTATVIGSIAPTTYVPIVSGTFTQPVAVPIPTQSTTSASSNGSSATNTGRTATFVVLALVLVGLGGFAVVMFLKRRNRRAQRLHEEASFYEKEGPGSYGTTAAAVGTSGLQREPSVASHRSMFDEEPEMAEAMQPVDAAGAYPDRAIHYGTNDFTYPPTAAPAAASYNGHSQHVVHQEEQYDQAYDQHSVAQEQYDQSYDAHAAYAAYDYQASSNDHQHQQYQAGQYDHGLAPPTAFRELAGRGSGMDQSIDSFYGGVTDPTLSQHIAPGDY